MGITSSFIKVISISTFRHMRSQKPNMRLSLDYSEVIVQSYVAFNQSGSHQSDLCAGSSTPDSPPECNALPDLASSRIDPFPALDAFDFALPSLSHTTTLIALLDATATRHHRPRPVRPLRPHRRGTLRSRRSSATRTRRWPLHNARLRQHFG